MQILIQSKKEDLSEHISKISKIKIENKQMNLYRNQYIEYLQKVSIENKSSNKEFFLILKYSFVDDGIEFDNSFKTAENKLLENFNKVKDTLSRTGVIIKQIDSREEIKNILQEMYQT